MVDIFKALAEERRLRILALLLDREMCVCEIEASLNMTQSNVSRHLNVLKNSSILESYKIAQWTYYKINSSFISKHRELWEYLCIKLRELPTYIKDNMEYDNYKVQDICNLNTQQL